jgi:regulator of protease activity HflC (stomatin/prohibitin superfamily)
MQAKTSALCRLAPEAGHSHIKDKDMMYVAVVTAIVAVILLMTLRVSIGDVTVFEYERGLKFVRGKLKGEIGPGLYRFLRPYTSITKIDTRPVTIAVNSQEVLTRDGVSVKASLSATYSVTDPMTAVLKSDSYVSALYTELQQSLRTAIGGVELEELLTARGELGAQLVQLSQSGASGFGVTLEKVAVRDLILPGDLKKAFAQVVKSRQEGLAALERARGETAALRNLANAAQMVERNPHLLQLRMVQIAEQQTGATFVIGMPQGTTPLAIRDGQDVASLPPNQLDEQ